MNSLSRQRNRVKPYQKVINCMQSLRSTVHAYKLRNWTNILTNFMNLTYTRDKPLHNIIYFVLVVFDFQSITNYFIDFYKILILDKFWHLYANRIILRIDLYASIYSKHCHMWLIDKIIDKKNNLVFKRATHYTKM